jgi:hypothetical protein
MWSCSSCRSTERARSRGGKPSTPPAAGMLILNMAGLLCLVAVAATIAGCGREASSRAENLGLAGEYVDIRS